MAAECGTPPGRLRGREVLELFRPQRAARVERFGELTAGPVGDPVEEGAAGDAEETGLGMDGVAYHPNRTELVARAYALGVLTPGVWPSGA